MAVLVVLILVLVEMMVEARERCEALSAGRRAPMEADASVPQPSALAKGAESAIVLGLCLAAVGGERLGGYGICVIETQKLKPV